jgi:hypothetical protein
VNVEKDAFQYLAYVLSKFSGGDLSDEERHSAFMLLCTLPDSACVKDFIKAANQEEVERAGLPSKVAEVLGPLLIRLEHHLPYAGRFASLFKSRTGLPGKPVSRL